MKGDKKKLLDLPEKVVKDLAKMATDARMSVKAYMEQVLIEHSKKK